MVKAIHPLLGVRLVTVNGSYIVRLAKVIPAHYFHEVEDVTIGNNMFPASVVQVGVSVIDPLKSDIVRFMLPSIKANTHVLVKGLRTVVGEEPRRDSTNVGGSTTVV